MPSPTELLWTKLEEKNYKAVEDLIKAHPLEELVNAINKKGLSLFMLVYEALPSSLSLFTFIVDHPDLI